MREELEAGAMVSLAAAHLVAAQNAGSSGGFPLDGTVAQILQFGLLGAIFLCVLFRKFLVPEWTLKQEEDRAKAERDDLSQRLAETRDQLNKLQSVFQDQMIPALTRSTEINARYTEELQRARYRRSPEPRNEPDEH